MKITDAIADQPGWKVIHETIGNPCRDIVEGRTTRRVLRTTPYVPPHAKILLPVRRATGADPAAELAALTDQARPRTYQNTDGLMEKFRSHIGPAGFTIQQCVTYLLDQGWNPIDPTANARTKFGHLMKAGQISRTGFAPRQPGQRGPLAGIYQFVPAPETALGVPEHAVNF